MTEKRNRGFAAMDAAKQKLIASKGGKAAHAKGTAHKFTTEEAREAGRKGGQAAHAKGTAHQFTTEEARAAGRKGGLRSRRRPNSPGEEESGPVMESEQPAEMAVRPNPRTQPLTAQGRFFLASPPKGLENPY